MEVEPIDFDGDHVLGIREVEEVGLIIDDHPVLANRLRKTSVHEDAQDLRLELAVTGVEPRRANAEQPSQSLRTTTRSDRRQSAGHAVERRQRQHAASKPSVDQRAQRGIVEP